MDADTRHQLKQNELAQALSWLRNLNDTRTRYLMLGAALVLVLVAAGFTWNRSQKRAVARSWQALGQNVAENFGAATTEKLAIAQESLRNLIAESSNPNVVGYGKLNLAKAYAEQALLDASQRPKGFEEAAKTLEEVVAEPKIDPMLRAAATFALATNYESLRKVDKAKALYTTLTTETRFDGSPFKVEAANRLKTMDDASVTVAFTPGAAPALPSPAPTSTLPPNVFGPESPYPPAPTAVAPATVPAAPSTVVPRPEGEPTPPDQTPPAQPAPAVPPTSQPAGQTP